MNERLHCLAWTVLLAFASVNALAADKLTVRINNQTITAWRTIDLESAKKEAIAAHKPIAWIASDPKLLDGSGTITHHGSQAATLHAFVALKDRTVLVFEDAYAENHKVLKIVDVALHTPNPHYTPPSVVFLNPQATQVLATVIYERDYAKRSQALADAWNQIKGKY